MFLSVDKSLYILIILLELWRFADLNLVNQTEGLSYSDLYTLRAAATYWWQH